MHFQMPRMPIASISFKSRGVQALPFRPQALEQASHLRADRLVLSPHRHSGWGSWRAFCFRVGGACATWPPRTARNRADCSADVGRSWTRQVHKGRSVLACNLKGIFEERKKWHTTSAMLSGFGEIQPLPFHPRNAPGQTGSTTVLVMHAFASLARSAVGRVRVQIEARRSWAAECSRTPCNSVRESLAWSWWRTTNLPYLISMHCSRARRAARGFMGDAEKVVCRRMQI